MSDSFKNPGSHVSENRLEKLVSGGQTGADRAATDVALRHGFPHGGWCPGGRKAEDGPIGGQYQLRETPKDGYLQRTEWNVRDSDATVIFTVAPLLTGGSLRTSHFARRHGKPFIHIGKVGVGYREPALVLQDFVAGHGVRCLNVAGSRESKEPGIWLFTYRTLEDAFFFGSTFRGLGGPGEG